MRRERLRTLFLFLILFLLCSGCGPAGSSGGHASAVEIGPDESAVPYAAPPMATSEFHADLAEGTEEAAIDISAVAEGYVAASAVSDRRLKFQVLMGDTTYNYDMSSDGKPSVFPLQSGDGHYTFRIMENVVDTKYAPLFCVECDVTLLDEFQPFLRPSDYSNYNEQSQCVRKAAQLASACTGKLGVVSAVYEFICDTVRYDYEKAATVRSGYLPVPDETMTTGKGICFDYASLAAAMLRSQGIPTKIVFGYVAPDDLYHAWNMFYTEETGWVTVSFEVSGKGWNRIDLTFSAGGADDEFIGDGSHYADVYFF